MVADLGFGPLVADLGFGLLVADFKYLDFSLGYFRALWRNQVNFIIKKNKILRLHPNPLLQVINNDQSLKSLHL